MTDLHTPTRAASHRTSMLTLAAGVLFIVAPPLVELVSGDAFLLIGIALLLLLAALPGLRRLQQGRDGAAGRWAVRLTTAGLVAMVVLVLSGDLLDAALDGSAQEIAEGAWLAVAAISAVSTFVGIIAFSLAMQRARVLSAAGIWTFLGGLALFLVTESFEQSLQGPVPWLADVLPPLAFVVAGVGLLRLGRSARSVEDDDLPLTEV